MPTFRSLSCFVLLTYTLFVSAVNANAAVQAVSAGPDMQRFAVGSRVKLHLENHHKMESTVLAVSETTISILPKHEKTLVVLPVADIISAHEHAPLESRFRMGPCVGPVSLAIASPFILGAYLSGH